LPPLTLRGQRQIMKSGQGESREKRLSDVLQQKVEQKVETSLVTMIEQKYQTAVKKLDKAELDVQKYKFQNELLQKDVLVL
jgi:hypothetical protein